MKTDFKKTMDGYRATAGSFRIVDVPPMQYLAVDGTGDPNTSQAFSDAITTLYPVGYKLKFAASSTWTATTSSCRWRRSGGPTT